MDFYSTEDFEPDCSIGYLIRRIHQMGLGALEPLFVAEGLSGIQWSALVSIWFGRGTTSAELARDLGHDKGAMTRLVDTLERSGWIVRERDAVDRRIVNLSLTPEGQAIALRCKTRVIARWNGWLADWDRGEIETLIALLQKMRGTLATATAEGTQA